jgi:hypothetical protein
MCHLLFSNIVFDKKTSFNNIHNYTGHTRPNFYFILYEYYSHYIHVLYSIVVNNTHRQHYCTYR